VRAGLTAAAVLAACTLTGCGGAPAGPRDATVRAEPSPTAATTAPAPAPRTPPTRPPSPPAATRSPASPTPRSPDPRWRFFTTDRAPHTSPWFEGRHRVMIGYGCTVAPWYSPDPRCPGQQGFHHGIDVAMPCGTPLRSAVSGRVVDPRSAGAPGPAYGVRPFRIRSAGFDVLIGHARRVFVHPGERVRAGQRIALASDSGAPDGCHLHFEVRRAAGGLDSAVDPSRWLRLSGG